MAEQGKVLIVDDDASHLEIYAMLLKQAGLQPLTLLVRFLGLDVPPGEQIDLVLLDYTLHSVKSSASIAQDIHAVYPSAPIVVLSDLWSLPADIKPFVADFVRKGQPAKLLETVRRLISCPPAQASGVSHP